MSENDSKIFFTGIYQLHQSICYLAEMLNEDNWVELSYLHETPQIIKVEVRSHH